MTVDGGASVTRFTPGWRVCPTHDKENPLQFQKDFLRPSSSVRRVL
jgi:hypothetical protein